MSFQIKWGSLTSHRLGLRLFKLYGSILCCLSVVLFYVLKRDCIYFSCSGNKTSPKFPSEVTVRR